MMGTHRFFNDRFDRFNRFDRFHRFHDFDRFNNETFVFVDTFGFPFFFPFYPYPYYGYYPYGYYGYGAYGNGGYGYGSTSNVVEVQRRLARAGYYHGPVDGTMGPQTRRAIRAYERDHNMRAYGVIDRQLLAILGLA
jgi:putative peptidoglycan binding protein